MKTKKIKILVLSELDRSTKTTLKTAVSLARMIDGEIELFSVKKPTEVVKTDNQFSALRSMKDEFCHTESKMQELISSISKEYQMNIGHRLTLGNVKSEIKKYLKVHKPDVIILGQRPNKPFQLVGNGITEFVMEHFDGTVLVSSEENALQPDQPFAMGFLNGVKPSASLSFSKDLVEHSIKPLKAFKIVEQTKLKKSEPDTSPSETIEFVFEKDENSVKNLSKYLKKNSINLLCVERNPNTTANLVDIIGSDPNKALSKLKVSLLFTGKQHLAVS